ncbi:multiheme c-type cytochrome [Thermodesulfobacterium hydrogeniphilum]|uniref:multiheme c-type cytochrome n=1 Tax=Thermodesulfobacterium hydrogeniphilum TaxID=161156 RepID=UPI00068B1637|nr:multiheme c-type cytochrome [Thermodesulfobacterium hydrogeniphilum]
MRTKIKDFGWFSILVLILIFLSFNQSFTATTFNKNNNYCMSCHRFSFIKTLPSGEKISVKINPKEIKNSVHGKFKCIACHSDFLRGKHPSYKFRSKKEYMIKMSKIVCQRCHTDKSLRKNPVHYNLSKTAPCIKCHGYHNVKPIKVARGGSENQYCLLCHSRPLTKKMENGEILSVQVKENVLMNSVHKKLKCIDCHKEFSKGKHPFRSFKSIKEYRAQANNICKQCHTKEMQQFEKSIHAQALVKGKNAPDCLKCHGYHNVVKISNNKQLQFNLCVNCHKKEAQAFEESIHYKALSENKSNSPTCSSCHKAHDVLSTNIANINKSCIKCHKGIKEAHNKWLYNPPFTLKSFVDVHFKGASCSACHVNGNKAIILTLINKSNNKPLTLEKISELLNLDPAGVKEKIDLNGDNIIEEKELWQFLNFLKPQVKIDLKGRLDIINANDAHRIVSKKDAIKDCTVCHNPQAKFVGKFEINKEGAKPEKINMERKVVNSIYAIPNIRDFYVLGLTKITILDIIFVLAALGGLAFAFGHLGLRIITTPIRRKRRGGY